MGGLILLITGRMGMLGLCNFSSSFSIGGESFFWVNFLIFFYDHIAFFRVLCICFWYFSVGSLEGVEK